MLNWSAWIVTAICALGILIVAGKMAVQHRRGEGSEAAAGLGWVLGACILVISGAQAVNALV